MTTVADAGDLDQHLAVGDALEHRAAQRADHRAAPRPTRVPRSGAMARWHSASAAASAASAGLRRRGEAEAGLHHALHLRLVGRAVAGDGLLHLVRRVLHDLAAGRGRLGQREPARLADAHRRAHVDLEEHLLDGHDVGLQLGDQARRARRAARPGAAAADRSAAW